MGAFYPFHHLFPLFLRGLTIETMQNVRVYPVRMLHNLVPELLVEPGRISRPCYPHGSLPLDGGFTGKSDFRSLRIFAPPNITLTRFFLLIASFGDV